MLEAIGNFSFEVGLFALGFALFAAGIGALIAKPALFERIPLIGELISGARIGIAVALVAAGSGAIGIAAGYMHRGTLDQSAALMDQLKAEKLLRDLAESRAKTFAAAREKAEKEARDLSDEVRSLTDRAREDDERSRTNDSASCLDARGVQRLNAIGRRKSRR